MSSVEAAELVAKLKRLSQLRAKSVLSLIDDLTELEALETAADLKAARDALGETEKPLPWNEVKARLDAHFRFSQPAS
ncbi:MAG: hypothetical protein M3R59_03085 [Verrucomicrobiota bacterium]|nr:hypothetical protein [Verrucomicrobiota bacterium]